MFCGVADIGEHYAETAKNAELMAAVKKHGTQALLIAIYVDSGIDPFGNFFEYIGYNPTDLRRLPSKRTYTCKTYDEVTAAVLELRKIAVERNVFAEFCHVLNHIGNCRGIDQCNGALRANYRRIIWG